MGGKPPPAVSAISRGPRTATGSTSRRPSRIDRAFEASALSGRDTDRATKFAARRARAPSSTANPTPRARSCAASACCCAAMALRSADAATTTPMRALDQPTPSNRAFPYADGSAQAGSGTPVSEVVTACPDVRSKASTEGLARKASHASAPLVPRLWSSSDALPRKFVSASSSARVVSGDVSPPRTSIARPVRLRPAMKPWWACSRSSRRTPNSPGSGATSMVRSSRSNCVAHRSSMPAPRVTNSSLAASEVAVPSSTAERRVRSASRSGAKDGSLRKVGSASTSARAVRSSLTKSMPYSSLRRSGLAPSSPPMSRTRVLTSSWVSSARVTMSDSSRRASCSTVAEACSRLQFVRADAVVRTIMAIVGMRTTTIRRERTLARVLNRGPECGAGATGVPPRSAPALTSLFTFWSSTWEGARPRAERPNFGGARRPFPGRGREGRRARIGVVEGPLVIAGGGARGLRWWQSEPCAWFDTPGADRVRGLPGRASAADAADRDAVPGRAIGRPRVVLRRRRLPAEDHRRASLEVVGRPLADAVVGRVATPGERQPRLAHLRRQAVARR